MSASSESVSLMSTTTSKKSFWRRSVTRRDIDDTDKNEPEAPKGPLGLTTVFEPDGQAVVDFIFVHGLNGGSRSTWSKAGDGTFWPQDWLSCDDAFHDVRIHTFGYSSGLNRVSVLDIQDFASNLLACVHHCPTMTSSTSAPIIFVGHSMGGLVIKKAYILARQIPEYNNLAERICAAFFLATPHQGAGVAQLLSRALALAGPRLFVNDLTPQSSMLQSINEEFPRYSDSLQLFSFYETRPMFYGAGRGLIVEKHCAVMNYTNERRACLDANHRDVARFSTPRDSSYRLVRNTLATTVDSQRASLKEEKELEHADVAALSKFLGVSGAPEDDLITSESRKLPGSCQWLVEKDTFQQWRDALTSKVFWLRGRPGAGKTVLASHVISHLHALGLDCCYFFFTFGDEEKGNVNALLRSMAWQMAVMHPEAFAAILQVANSWTEAPIDKIDHIPVWRRIFNDAILKVKLKRPQYWVIDAVDECKNSSELMFFLKKAQEIWPLCILATSREGVETYLSTTNPSMEVISEIILEDNKSDIASFLSANLHRLPGATIDAQQDISDRILRNSRGCFLWVSLVLGELREVHTAVDISQVLDNTHSGMDALYARILDDMSHVKFGKDLARAILTWATRAFRPLSVSEIHSAVEADMKDSIDDIGKSISTCGNLVFIDQANRVQLIHLTAREFLSQKDINPEFIIDGSVAHKRLALVCIQTLRRERGNLKKSPKNRHIAGDITSHADSVLYDYASTYLFQHALQIEPIDDEIFIELANFLGSHEVLTWIEHLAKQSDLQRLYQAGKSCTNLVTRRKHQTPVVNTQKQLSLVERWGIDLVRLVNKFGKRLNQCPSSIHSSIPPFCPSESSFRKQFVNPYRGLNLQGCISEEWDDRLCTISYPRISKPADIASSGTRTAIALSNGTVVIYDNATLLETNTLVHQEPVWSITFGKNGRLFATGGAKTVRLWDLNSSEQVISFRVPAVCMSMIFSEDDEVLLVAVKNNLVIYWDILNNVSRGDPIDWTRDLLETDPQLHARRPMVAAFGVEQNLLAIIYRGEDILLWALDGEEIYDMYDKDNGSYRHGSTKVVYAKSTVSAVAFGSTLEKNLLAAAYSDGDVVIFDTDSGERQGFLESINAQTIACSPDGRTLATADSLGNVNLFDLRTFKLIYRLRLNMDAIRVKKIGFTSDGLRLLNISSKQFSVWDPTVLLRHEFEDDISETASYSTIAKSTEYGHAEEEAAITAMTCMAGASGVICGKEDGTVLVFNTSSGSHGQELFTHTRNFAIKFLHYDNEGCTLTCVDTSNRVTSRKLIRKAQGSWTSGEIMFDNRSQLVSQVVASIKHDRLLISTSSSDALWSLAATSAVDCVPCLEGSPKQRWLTLPGSQDLLIRFGTDAATFYQWESLTPIGSVELIIPENVPLRSIVPFHHPHYFATAHSLTSIGLPVANVYHLWDLRDFASKVGDSSNAGEDRNKIGPVLNFKLDTKVYTVIGVANERVIFLDPDNWVCSADINPTVSVSDKAPGVLSSDRGDVVRHFFIPDDWMSLVNNVQVDVRQSGEVVFAKRADLAVIRRGLEITDKGVSGSRRFSGARLIPRRPADK